MRNILLSLLLVVGTAVPSCAAKTGDFRSWAPTPPMGWNSWDCYYSSVNEAQVLQNARYMRDNLKDYGWEYVVVDIRWFMNHPSLGGGWYNERGDQDPVLDEYGRYLPSPTRFPSVMKHGKNRGFKAVADSIHRMGLKFGIHIMRGLPKYIVEHPEQYRLKGTKDVTWDKVYTHTNPECTWLHDNLTIQDNEYGQLYYNSIIEMYADWGVDFIKVDDIARPFNTAEITMLRRAIDGCGRPIVLSLSPGKTAFKYVDDCHRLANMWRMMDDLWDTWHHVEAVFAEAAFWIQHHQVGNYADCDMLPLGRISMTNGDEGYTRPDKGRYTRLTHDEQVTLMTLWGMCHSPLMFGGEMTQNDAFTLSLLTNREYLYMHHYAVDNKQLYRDDTHVVWTARHPETGEQYIALFNTGSEEDEVSVDLTQVGYGAQQEVHLYDIWQRAILLHSARGTLSWPVPAHGAVLLKTSANR